MFSFKGMISILLVLSFLLSPFAYGQKISGTYIELSKSSAAGKPTRAQVGKAAIYFNAVANRWETVDDAAVVSILGMMGSFSATAPITYNSGTGAIGISATPTFTGITLTGFSGFVRASAGVLSASALIAGDIPDLSATYSTKTAGGDLSGNLPSPSVATVGGASAVDIADAVTKRHTQNTDSGTTSPTFIIASGGFQGIISTASLSANRTFLLPDLAGTTFLTTGSSAGAFPALNQNTTGSSASFTGSLAGDVTGTQSVTVVAKINGATVPTIGSALQQIRVNSGATALEYFTPTGGIAGSGTVNTIPKFVTDTTTLGNSSITDNGSVVAFSLKAQFNSMAVFNGTTSSFPGLTNSGAKLQAQLADGSALTQFEASHIGIGATVTKNSGETGIEINHATDSQVIRFHKPTGYEYRLGTYTIDGKFYITNNNGPAALGASTNGIILDSSGAVSIGTATQTGKFTVAQGTITTAVPPIAISYTTNAGGVTFPGFTLDQTDTASASGSLLANLKVNGTSKFSVRKDGRIDNTGDIEAAGTIHGAYIVATNYFAIGTYLMTINTTYNAMQFQNYSGPTLSIIGGIPTNPRTSSQTFVNTYNAGESGILTTNTGASGAVTITLGGASVNAHHYFAVTAGQNLIVDALGTDTIRIGASVTAAGGNLTSNTIGNTLHIVCVKSGEWFVVSHEGTWTVN